MGIKKGLTKRFAEIGKIKIGGKGETRKSAKGVEYQLPVRYEHFVVTTTEKGSDGNFIIDNTVMKALTKDNPEPKEIPIRLPFDDIDLNFYTSFQMYQGSKCICRGDGENAVRVTAQGTEQHVKCSPDTCQYLKDEKCKVSGILSCHIPCSMEAGGIYRFRTHSWNSVSAILASLEYISDNTNGVLQGLPLKLKFLKKATAEHGNVNIVTLVLDGLEMMKLRELAYLEYENRMKLGIDMHAIQEQAKVAGFLEDHDDPADIEEEFYPPVVAEAEQKGVSAESAEKELAEKEEKPDTTDDVQGDLL